MYATKDMLITNFLYIVKLNNFNYVTLTYLGGLSYGNGITKRTAQRICHRCPLNFTFDY